MTDNEQLRISGVYDNDGDGWVWEPKRNAWRCLAQRDPDEAAWELPTLRDIENAVGPLWYGPRLAFELIESNGYVPAPGD